MHLESVQELKKLATNKVIQNFIRPYSSNSSRNETLPIPPALGIHLSGKGNYKLAIHIPHKSHRELIQPVVEMAKGEINVQITGPVYPQTLVKQHHKRPLCIGISISHSDPLAGTGTLGCFVRKRGESELLILSNNHVLANTNNAQIGDAIIQPAREDYGKEDTDQIASLKEFVPLKTGEMNFIDAATATVKNTAVGQISELSGICFLKGFYNQQEFDNVGDDDSHEFMVAKVGRRTGYTLGKIIDYDMDYVRVPYNQELNNCIFNNIITIEGDGNKAFSRRGDSGSIIVDQDGYAIGLLFAGTDIGGSNGCGITYAIPISEVLQELDLELALT
ncbi:hypothetical protein NIES4103_38700 [Nostoc sp. NIES-4103]|nr:hypothetical protein NIES4103_38700 [Nostoc sp. NIES-4103]